MSKIKVKKPKPKTKVPVPVSMTNMGRALAYAYVRGHEDHADGNGGPYTSPSKDQIQEAVSKGIEIALGAPGIVTADVGETN